MILATLNILPWPRCYFTVNIIHLLGSNVIVSDNILQIVRSLISELGKEAIHEAVEEKTVQEEAERTRVRNQCIQQHVESVIDTVVCQEVTEICQSVYRLVIQNAWLIVLGFICSLSFFS